MAYFPQINSNLIITQLPYSSGMSYESVSVDMETGMRYSYPRRGAGLSGYPTGPLGRFDVAYSSITDDEVDDLLTFFRSMRGSWGSFRFLDPHGNLLQYSEDFSQSYWDKSVGVSVGSSTTDPFGGTLATVLTGTGDASMKGRIGPADGGMSGFVMCASAWVKTSGSGVQLAIGFINSGSTHRYTIHNLPQNAWVRISHTEVLWDNNEFRFILGGQSTWSGSISVFGAQVSPMKGEGGYIRTPGGYGYHENCRFDIDVFDRRALGPNQNSIRLPIVEFNV